MKNAKLCFSFLLIFSSLLFTNCSKDQVEDYRTTTSEFISQGKWAVDYLYSSQDMTARFASYEFIFLGNGTVTTIGGQHDLSGTWQIIRDVNRNDVLLLNITTQDPQLSVLNDQWNVTGKSTNILAMNDGTAELRLKKL